MPAWVSSAVRPAPRDRTVFVRFGSSMFDAGFCRWRNKWFALYPGSREEIPGPPLWWDREAPSISKEAEYLLVFGRGQTSARAPRGPRQALLSFEMTDSNSLSRTDVGHL
jgi:hypothetical protein